MPPIHFYAIMNDSRQVASALTLSQIYNYDLYQEDDESAANQHRSNILQSILRNGQLQSNNSRTQSNFQRSQSNVSVHVPSADVVSESEDR